MSTPIPSLGNKTPEQLKVAELREELKKRGIHIKGLKKDLVERLDEILRQEAAEANDLSKKSSPEEADDDEGEAEIAATPAAAIEVVMEPAEVDAAVPEVELKPGLVEVELGESLPQAEIKPETIQVELSVSLPEEDGLSIESKEVETERLQEIVMDPKLASKEVDVIGPVCDLTAESLPEADFHTPKKGDEESGPAIENSPAMDVSEVSKPFEGGAKIESAEASRETGEIVKAEDIISAENMNRAEPDVDKPPEAELHIQDELLKPIHYLGTTSSTDAVIIDASEAEDIPAENASITEGVRTLAYDDRDMEEGEGSVGGETVTEPKEIVKSESVIVETVSVTTETTVVTTETIVMNEVDADLSTAQAEHEEGSFTLRISDSGTLINDGKEKDEAVEEQHRDKDEEGVEVEQEAKAKDSKPMEIDSESLTGMKRKDGDDSKHQEPTKRQRRWNSEKSAGAIADVKAPPKVITTDTFKEIIAPEVRESIQAPVARSPSTTASSTLKASASASFDKPTPSRPALSRTDIAGNGEADKKRLVPPPSRTPTISLKIDRFVRPFTINAVRELLEQTGTVKEMWMDHIKTHCYVTYSSVEEAIATRSALYHLQWPVAGGKLLVAEFVEPEDVKARVDGVTDKSAPTPITTPRGSASNSTQVVGSAGLTSPGVPVPASALPPPPPLPPPPRKRPALPARKEQEPPIPTLDDLFKKTRTKPQIYFLPLTEEQVAAKLRNKQPVGKAPLKG